MNRRLQVCTAHVRIIDSFATAARASMTTEFTAHKDLCRLLPNVDQEIPRHDQPYDQTLL